LIPNDPIGGLTVALSRKRQKELNRLKSQAEDLCETYEDRVKPAVASGVAGARSAALSTRDRLVDDVLPAMSSALGTALAAIEVAKNKQVREAISRATKFGMDVGTQVGIIKPKPVGAGRYILIGIGVVAAAAVAYAAWQTLRADDDLWVEDEPEEPTAG